MLVWNFTFKRTQLQLFPADLTNVFTEQPFQRTPHGGTASAGDLHASFHGIFEELTSGAWEDFTMCLISGIFRFLYTFGFVLWLSKMSVLHTFSKQYLSFRLRKFLQKVALKLQLNSICCGSFTFVFIIGTFLITQHILRAAWNLFRAPTGEVWVVLVVD